MNSTPRKSLLVVLLLLSAGAVAAAEEEERQQQPKIHRGKGAAVQAPVALRALAYNTHLLPALIEPWFGKRGKSPYRAAQIGKAAARYDIAGLCETFSSGRRRRLVEAADEASQGEFWRVESPLEHGRLVGGGLMILSRLPIEQAHFAVFKNAGGYPELGPKADVSAAKGVLHARIRICEQPLRRVDVFVTHLDSRSAKARDGQLQEMAAFINRHTSENGAALLLGDLNIAADDNADSQYAQMTKLLRQTRPQLADVWATLSPRGVAGTTHPETGDSRRRIDYVFCTARAASWLTPQEARVRLFPDEQVPEKTLSDHAGVECVLKVAGGQ